jgi:hypothetical protein
MKYSVILLCQSFFMLLQPLIKIRKIALSSLIGKTFSVNTSAILLASF